jgi:tetratricopeptide (TPR) repeat protein
VIALAPRRPGIHFRLGRALLLRWQQTGGREEDAAEAMREFEQELEIDPTNANAAYELGVAHYRRGQFEKAREAFAKALTNYPEFQEASVGMGRTLLALGKADMALTHLRKAIALKPEDEVPHYHLSRAYRELGNAAGQQKAMAEFRRLRSRRSEQEPVLAQETVTRQEVDADVKQ